MAKGQINIGPESMYRHKRHSDAIYLYGLYNTIGVRWKLLTCKCQLEIITFTKGLPIDI